MLGGVTEAIESGDEEKLITTLKDSVFADATVQDDNASYYITALKTVEVSFFPYFQDQCGDTSSSLVLNLRLDLFRFPSAKLRVNGRTHRNEVQW